MKIIKKNAFIIAEYNPFHNGHQYHIEQTRECGAENIICIMNGNFVQRGEPALFSKSFRAASAIRNGADLVIELPLKYGVSSANYFAFGGVSAAVDTGLDGTLSFGASACRDDLSKLAEISVAPDFVQQVKVLSESSGKSFPSAMQKLLHEKYSTLEYVTEDANNILALEYLKAARSLHAEMDWEPIQRALQCGHDSEIPIDTFASAKYLRQLLIEGEISAAAKYLPENVLSAVRKEIENGASTENRQLFSRICMATLMNMKTADFQKINGVSQGIENRIEESVKQASTLSYLYDSVKTKRFTHARIRQVILSAVLGVTRDDLYSGTNYIRVLAFNDKGQALLKTMRKTACVPIISNISEISDSFSSAAKRDKELDVKAGKLFELCKSRPSDINAEFHVKPVIYT